MSQSLSFFKKCNTVIGINYCEMHLCRRKKETKMFFVMCLFFSNLQQLTNTIIAILKYYVWNGNVIY